LSLAIQFGARSGECPVDRSQLRRWAAAALGQDAALTLRFVGSAEGRTLNHEFRGRDYATNVLTFEYPMMGEGPLEADIVICLPVLAKEARAQGKSLRDHLAHLVVHGTLHAQGMDHENDADAQAMGSPTPTAERRVGRSASTAPVRQCCARRTSGILAAS
jgi:probable rRNA maturation factor